MRIVVISYGFVFVCKDMVETPTHFTMHNARCIQKWGTDSGLGQLVSGPQSSTVLQSMIPVVTAPIASLVYYFDVSESAWEKHLS